ncbi:unnamed protein product, partial [Sphacelaria rigidula]
MVPHTSRPEETRAGNPAGPSDTPAPTAVEEHARGLLREGSAKFGEAKQRHSNTHAARAALDSKMQ